MSQPRRSRFIRRTLDGLTLLAVCAVATTLWIFAMTFADSEADEIPTGLIESAYWYATSTGAMLSSWAAFIRFARTRQTSFRLLSATAALSLLFFAGVAYLA